MVKKIALTVMVVLMAASMGWAGGWDDKKGGREDLLKRMNYVGKRFYKMGLIDHIGALSQLNFKNALSLVNETIILEPENSKEISDVSERLSQLGQKLYDLSHYRS
jgi:hypothetical protein